VVHSGGSGAPARAMVDNSQDFNTLFEIEVDENPFDFKATLTLKTDDKLNMVKYYVYDGTNKLLHYKELAPSQKYRFGEVLRSGQYIVKVIQGNNMKIIRMIKE